MCNINIKNIKSYINIPMEIICISPSYTNFGALISTYAPGGFYDKDEFTSRDHNIYMASMS